MESNGLFFVSGALRSGTTLLHVMLDNHPEIMNPGEFDFLFDEISNSGDFPSIADYHHYLSLHRIFKAKMLTIDQSLGYSDLINSFVQQKRQPNIRLALNVHRAFDRIPFVFPNAKFIHLIRDPRDVARSSIGMGWAGNVYYGVEHWIETEKSWKRLVENISKDQYIEIKFEDLILSPELVLKKICDFLDVSYSDEIFNYVDNSTYSKPDPSLVNQWKTKQSVREVQHVEYKASSIMKDLGYELSGYPFSSPNMIEKIYLAINNKAFKLKYMIKKYGVSLVLKKKLANRIGLNSIYNQAILSINEIDKKGLK